MFSVPDGVVARRPFTLNGVKVPAGTALSKDQVIAIGRELNALLDNGTLVAKPDPNARRNKQPQPTSLPPKVRNAMLAKMGPAKEPLSVSAKAVGKSVSVEVAGGNAPFTVEVEGAEPQTKKTRTFAVTVTGVGTHAVSVTDGAGDSASTSVTIIVEKGK